MLPLVVVCCTSKQSVSQCVKLPPPPAWIMQPPPTGRHRWTGLFHPQREADHYAKTTEGTWLDINGEEEETELLMSMITQQQLVVSITTQRFPASIISLVQNWSNPRRMFAISAEITFHTHKFWLCRCFLLPIHPETKKHGWWCSLYFISSLRFVWIRMPDERILCCRPAQ